MRRGHLWYLSLCLNIHYKTQTVKRYKRYRGSDQEKCSIIGLCKSRTKMEGGRGCVSERVHAAADLNLNIAHPAMFLKFTAGLGRDGSCDVTTIGLFKVTCVERELSYRRTSLRNDRVRFRFRVVFRKFLFMKKKTKNLHEIL